MQYIRSLLLDGFVDSIADSATESRARYVPNVNTPNPSPFEYGPWVMNNL